MFCCATVLFCNAEISNTTKTVTVQYDNAKMTTLTNNRQNTESIGSSKDENILEFTSNVISLHEQMASTALPRGNGPSASVSRGNGPSVTVSRGNGPFTTVSRRNGSSTTVSRGNGTSITVSRGNGPSTTVSRGNGPSTTVSRGNGPSTTVSRGNGPSTTVSRGNGHSTTVSRGNGPSTTVSRGNGPSTTVSRGNGPFTTVSRGNGPSTTVSRGNGPSTTVSRGNGPSTTVSRGNGPSTTVSNMDDPYKETPKWVKVVDITQTICSFVGFTANCVTFITLTRSSSGMGSAVRTLLRHQSAIDAIVCLLAAIMVLSPPMWTPGIHVLDQLICHIWHSQIVYWDFYLISVWNLVTVAIERFVCVVKPLSHPSLMSKGKLRVAIIMLHVLSLFMVSLGILQVRFDGTKCVSGYAFDVLSEAFYVYGFLVFLMWHFLPVILFIVFYGYIIAKLKGRVHGDLPKSAVIEKASKELTKTAIAVTIVFMISTSFDLWYYLLGRTGVVLYIKGSPLQKAGVLLSIFNICANPFVYIMMMPAYRRDVLNLLLCRWRNEGSSQHVSNSSGSHQTSHVSKSFSDIRSNSKIQ